MDALPVAGAAIVTAGAAVAVSSQVPRLAALGLLVTLVASPFLADPATAVPLLTRIIAGVLAVQLLWVALREAPARTRGSLIGWPAEGAAALVAAVAGWELAASLAALGSEPTALVAAPLASRASGAAAAATVVLAIVPVLLARDVLRMGIGVLLLLPATELAMRAVRIEAGPLAQVALAIATVAVGAAVAWTTRRAADAGQGFLLPSDTRRARR